MTLALALDHELIISRGLSRLPAQAHDDARRYIESRLRPIRQIVDSDVRAAVGAAVVKYGAGDHG